MSKLLDAIKLKGAEIDIPDVGRDDLPAFFKEMGYKVGAEIGVATGLYSEKLCQAGLKVYAVDPWLEYPGYDSKGVQVRLDKEYEEAKQRLAPYDCTIIRKKSVEAAQDFEDGSLDFVYIDGHHGFKFVTEDIYEWSKKVRIGGVVAGHDFVHSSVKTGPYVCHVKHVVRAYTTAFRIRDWYVLGSKHLPKDSLEKRDRWRSWMWIRKENYER
jgi:hypothetical protein